MGRAKQADYHYFDDDTIALYTRPGSKAWQARVRLDTGKALVKSTGKTDLKEALAVARKMQAQGQAKIEWGSTPPARPSASPPNRSLSARRWTSRKGSPRRTS